MSPGRSNPDGEAATVAPSACSPHAGASASAIQHHYDVGAEFYRLWLDDSMTYTCALWSGAANDTLEEAQRRKNSFFLDHVSAGPGTTLLDIGCGFGAMLEAAAMRDIHAHGLTLSVDQHSWIMSHSSVSVTADLLAWQDFEAEQPYDAITSIGCIEHAAQDGLSESERVDAYREFFRACWLSLTPGGKLGLQAIMLDGNAPPSGPLSQLLLSETFPESVPVRSTDLFLGLEPWFVVESLVNHPHHYARTCREWHGRLRANGTAAIDLIGAERVRSFEQYLAASEMTFRQGVSGLYRMVLHRRDETTGRSRWARSAPFDLY